MDINHDRQLSFRELAGLDGPGGPSLVSEFNAQLLFRSLSNSWYINGICISDLNGNGQLDSFEFGQQGFQFDLFRVVNSNTTSLVWNSVKTSGADGRFYFCTEENAVTDGGNCLVLLDGTRVQCPGVGSSPFCARNTCPIRFIVLQRNLDASARAIEFSFSASFPTNQSLHLPVPRFWRQTGPPREVLDLRANMSYPRVFEQNCTNASSLTYNNSNITVATQTVSSCYFDFELPSIVSFVFEDRDANGIFNASVDKPLPGIQVTLSSSCSKTVSRRNTSDNNGTYVFDHFVPNGLGTPGGILDVCVFIDMASPRLAGYIMTSPSLGTVNCTGRNVTNFACTPTSIIIGNSSSNPVIVRAANGTGFLGGDIIFGPLTQGPQCNVGNSSGCIVPDLPALAPFFKQNPPKVIVLPQLLFGLVLPSPTPSASLSASHTPTKSTSISPSYSTTSTRSPSRTPRPSRSPFHGVLFSFPPRLSLSSTPILTNEGVQCWNECNARSGPCLSFCGTGLCCRRYWNYGESGCPADQGGVTAHICVRAPTGSSSPLPLQQPNPYMYGYFGSGSQPQLNPYAASYGGSFPAQSQPQYDPYANYAAPKLYGSSQSDLIGQTTVYQSSVFDQAYPSNSPVPTSAPKAAILSTKECSSSIQMACRRNLDMDCCVTLTTTIPSRETEVCYDSATSNCLAHDLEPAVSVVCLAGQEACNNGQCCQAAEQPMTVYGGGACQLTCSTQACSSAFPGGQCCPHSLELGGIIIDRCFTSTHLCAQVGYTRACTLCPLLRPVACPTSGIQIACFPAGYICG
eukprot:gb/GEZN01001455.1/.p1 GENE.gb/GEZN01001455.1/~~gb/GEZN01001455.1/.p1  ORF type:complete len:907 (+),score=68.60 gb/GEZN01001455.1/:325-2721(+)